MDLEKPPHDPHNLAFCRANSKNTSSRSHSAESSHWCLCRTAVEAFDRYDLVIVHVEAPDEAGHLGDLEEKVKAIERVDAHVVGPEHRRVRPGPLL